MSCGANKWWGAALALLLLATSCEPRTIEIQGLDELTSEIRSQRLLNSRRTAEGNPAPRTASQVIPSEQIHAAMSPLRDVLMQLAASQKELSARQATLTREMRRWTQLLVESMQANRTDEASKLSKRLADLEKTIAEQDVRHRQVEELLGSALDATADQLEDFLKRLGAGAPEGGPEVPTGTGGVQPTGSGSTPTPAAGKTAPPNNTSPPNKPPGSGGTAPPTGVGGDDPQQASMRWVWWTLAVMAVVSGLVLLRGRRRRPPVSMAPEMQFAPEPTPQEFAPEQPTPVAKPAATHRADDPEVEDLWATAALLGEAIGRLKQTGDATPVELGGQEALPDVLDFELPSVLNTAGESAWHDRATGDLDLNELFVVDEHESDIPEPTPPDEALRDIEAEAIHTLGLPDPEPEREPEAMPIETAPDLIAPEPVAAEPMPQLAARQASPAPITCRLHLQANEQTEGRVRRLLGSDPRVLVSPAPQIRSAMGELEVSFALMPGLPAGERSLLEQQLRDTVA